MDETRRRGRRAGGPAMNARGQVTVPRHLRDALRIGPGSEVAFVVDDRGEVVLRVCSRHGDPPARDRSEVARGRAAARWRADELGGLERESVSR